MSCHAAYFTYGASPIFLSLCDFVILFPEFHDRYGPWAVIAGASEGIGQSYANILAERGFNLVTIARRIEPLEKDAALLRRRHRVDVRPVSIDLAADNLADLLSQAIDGLDVGLLVYNACYSKIGRFLEVTAEEHQTMLDVNCRGPVTACQVIAPRLAQRGKGGIILMSSMSGFQGSAMISTYAATKAFNTNLAQSLWVELKPKGVDVMACVAGATSTPGFNNNTPEEKRSVAFPMRPDPVAREGLNALGKKPVHITGGLNRTVRRATSLMPLPQRTRFFSKATEDMYGESN